eukprot:CAMPEP_0198285710 /NCGR_PEP_ID=MMETSP1449-20131203/4950_1 /TAXON_ID=420275 /ORGANISM="Attheya septentrionalis, Strain CCMP2084" /LENGTH=512 /DNA_ID=CAMNT_0043983225 /DNA_START=273 /DNA_END=1811 /DNA_ORIENTATION=+
MRKIEAIAEEEDENDEIELQHIPSMPASWENEEEETHFQRAIAGGSSTLSFDYEEQNGEVVEMVVMELDTGTISRDCCSRKRYCYCCCRKRDDGWDDDVRQKPSNELLLSTAFISFLGFTIVQSVAAYIAHSEAMMGDSAAMGVDALTYGFNFWAERRKNQDKKEGLDNDSADDLVETEEERARRLKVSQRNQRKRRLHLELVPPLISVATLIAVTAVVTTKAIQMLILDSHRAKAQQGNPNLGFMLLFSSLNLFLDFLNVFCFARAKHAFGYNTIDQHGADANLKDEKRQSPRDKVDRGLGPGIVRKMGGRSKYNPLPEQEEIVFDHIDVDENDYHGKMEDIALENKMGNGYAREDASSNGTQAAFGPKATFNNDVDFSIQRRHEFEDEHTLSNNIECEEEEATEDSANLNMCSAYTHVFADTVRSIALIIASVIAEFVDGVTSEVADATAALVVSLLILLSLIPLFQGLRVISSELSSIRAEERDEGLAQSMETQQTQDIIVTGNSSEEC